MLLRGLAVPHCREELIAFVEIVDAQGEPLARLAAALHALGKAHFLLGIEQWDAPDLLQVQADGVVDVDQVQVDVNLRWLRAFFLRFLFVFLSLAEGADLDSLFE